MSSAEFYLRHFGLEREATSLSFLKKIMQAFATLPYENATKIIEKFDGGVKRIRTSSVLLRGFAEEGSGGTCFALVQTLYQILDQLKFDCYRVLADRTYGENTHAAIVANVGDEQYILDPGFLMAQPIPAYDRTNVRAYPTPMNDLIVERQENAIKVSTLRKGKITFRYAIKNRPVPSCEYHDAWQKSYDLEMNNDLFLTKATKDGQIYLRNNRVEIITPATRKKYYLEGDGLKQIHELFGISENILAQASLWLQKTKQRR